MDISKCTNEYCTLKETCYRYTVEAGEFMQAYGAFVQDKDDKCDAYWEVEEL